MSEKPQTTQDIADRFQVGTETVQGIIDQWMSNRLLTIDEMAQYLQVSTKTVYRMIQRKEIPCYKVANQWRFKWQRIQEWLETENYQASEPGGKQGE